MNTLQQAIERSRERRAQMTNQEPITNQLAKMFKDFIDVNNPALKDGACEPRSP